jgi:hypothetical protein
MPWYLVATDGPVAGSSFRLLNDRVTVGRDSDNDIVVDDHLVSRHHARLEGQQETVYAVHDLGSTNGTWLNGQRVTLSDPIQVQYGDRLTLGTKSTFVFSNRPFIEDRTVMADPGSRPQPASAAPPHAQTGPVDSSASLQSSSEAGWSGSWVCPECGTPNPVGTRFCGNCGAPLTVHREVVCRACGAMNESGRRYCGNCGQPLTPPKSTNASKGSGGKTLLLAAAGVVVVLVLLALLGAALFLALNLGGLFG